MLLLELARGGDVERFGLRLGGFGLGGRTFGTLSLLRSRSFVELFSFRFSSRRSCFSDFFATAPPVTMAAMVSLLEIFGVLPDFSFFSRFSLLFSVDRSFDDDFCDGILLLDIDNLLLLILLLVFESGELFEFNMGEPNRVSNVLVGFTSSDLILCFLPPPLLLPPPIPPILLPPPLPPPLLCGRGFVVESGCEYTRSSIFPCPTTNKFSEYD